MSDVPQWATCLNADNRPVPLPVWQAKKILEALESFNRGKPRTRTPCYAAEYNDAEEDLRALIQLVETGGE